MDNTFNNAIFISSQINRDLILYKNPIDGKVNVFVFLELIHKTTNTPYHEFTGQDITDEILKMNHNTWDTNSFLNRLDKKMLINIKSSDNNWIWLKAINTTQ
jgi:hypothetical protein